MRSEPLDDISIEVAPPRPRGTSRAKPARNGQNLKLRYLEKEVFGILLFSLGLFFLFSLVTHNAADPSWNTFRSALSQKQSLTVSNWTGPVGAYVSDLMLQVFGFSAFFIPLGLFFSGVSLLFMQTIRVNVKRLAGFLLILLFGAAFFSLFRQEFTLFSRTFPAGGILGEFLAQITTRFFNRLGAGILLGGALLASFVGVTHFSVPKTAGLLSEFLSGQQHLAHFFSALFQQYLSPLMKPRKKTKAKLTPLENPILQDEENEKLAISGEFSDEPPEALENRRKFELAEDPDEIEPAKKTKAGAEGPLIVTRPKELPTRAPKIQETLNFRKSTEIDYKLPPPELLFMDLEKPKPVDEWSLRMNSKILEKKLLDYGVEGKVVEIHPGPVITMYEFQPAPGVKVGKIVNLSDDLSLSMGGRSVRIVAPIPNKPVVGIEIPNTNREFVPLHEIITQESFINDKGLTLALGKDTEGAPYAANLAKMPHLLIAGATGTGKSVAINSMICSLLMKFTPDQVRFLMVDPKMVELPMYEGIPHLLLPVITDAKKAALALKWAVNEMERRLKLLSEAGTRNIDNFNRKAHHKTKDEAIEVTNEDGTVGDIQSDPQSNSSDLSKVILNRHGELPFIVILIDELADLMMMSGRDVEESITRLAQMARAVGIHLILATQRPSVDVITGLIKANFPARISFKVSSRIDSRTVIDIMGAESLLGGGDMLFMRPDSSHLTRVHGSYVTETEVEKVVSFLKKQGQPEYEESILTFSEEAEAAAAKEDDLAGEDEELFQEAVDAVVSSGQASTSYVQRRLRIGYNRAARLMEIMERRGIVGPADGAKPREILNSTYEHS